jgi:hypothetical protein
MEYEKYMKEPKFKKGKLNLWKGVKNTLNRKTTGTKRRRSTILRTCAGAILENIMKTIQLVLSLFRLCTTTVI